MSALLTAILASSGCAAIVVTEANNSAKAKTARERFEARFAASNASRVKAGHLPLDLCSERYWFDREWAGKDRVCAARIRRYENGDSTALDPPNERSISTVPAVPDSIQRIYDERQKVKDREAWKYQAPG